MKFRYIGESKNFHLPPIGIFSPGNGTEDIKDKAHIKYLKNHPDFEEIFEKKESEASKDVGEQS